MRSGRAAGHGFSAKAAGFLVPPSLWTLYAVSVTSVQGAACTAKAARGIQTGMDLAGLAISGVVLATSVAIGAFGLWSYRAWCEATAQQVSQGTTPSLLACGAVLNAAFFLIATLWLGFAALVLAPCPEAPEGT